MRLSCRLLGYVLLLWDPLWVPACTWRLVHGIAGVTALVASIALSCSRRKPMSVFGSSQSLREFLPQLSSPFLDDLDITSRELTKSELTFGDNFGERYSPSPSPLRDCSSLAMSPPRGGVSEKLAVKRYLRRSRWELVGLCLPFFLFHSISVGFGTFRFLVPSPLKGFESTKGRYEVALYIEGSDLVSYLGVTSLISFLVPKLALLYASVAACFVWFGLGISLYSVSHTDIPTERLQYYPGASLFYDCAFHIFCSGQRVALFLIALEAMHTRVRVTAFGWSYCASQAGGAIGLLATYWFFDSSSPSTVLLMCAVIMLIFIHILRTMTPTLSIAHATLDDIDFRTVRRFASEKSEDLTQTIRPNQSSIWSPESRRPSVKSTRSRNSLTNLSRIERQTIANFI
eukprot:Blabericola_migrator_1__9238@NODE_495_length_8027_cov_122_376382_g27_i3_p2_GENE_NODE_495_length_8027_cov_122_376382_g27_i3NODE_495_length_8027_cov_122_376382_g27_i3_p2_ORF_typecomplete_len401_score12_07Sugar_tr/PF00083_24/3_1e02Sugar_tr/PF00083_24/2_1e06MFS_1/PF07690_16/9_9MFS_1/PF07690_16/4_4e05_NODE_495_length_8027_cov_122_376382_g27_i35891791